MTINLTPRPSRPGGLSRRSALGLGLGAAGSLALASCSNEGRGTQAPPEGDGGDGASDLPTSVQFPEIEGVVLSDVEGVPPAYTALPYPGEATVPEKPGRGGEMETFTITWGAPPKLAEDGNQWHQAINEALGVDLMPIIVPAQTYGDKLVTTIASGSIPEITTNEPSYRGRAARKYMPQGVFHDLRNFLGGDKVLDYPNLAMVPSFAWENSRIEGALYGVPCYRNQTVGGAIAYRQDWAEKGGFGDRPTNLDEWGKWLKAIKDGGGDKAYVTATLDQTLSMAGFQVHGVCNNWVVQDGKLVKDLETEEYEAGLAFAAQMWKDGLVHPNMLTLTPNPAEFRGQFYAGRVGMTNQNLDGYFGPNGELAQLKQRDPDADAQVMVPPGMDGGPGVVYPDLGFYCMLSIPSSVTDEERIHEILGVMNFLAAPMGSKEYYLVRYGVEGHNYTIEDGSIVQTTDEEIRLESFLSQLGAFNQGFYYAGAPAEEALAAQKVAEEMVPAFIADPTTGLDSEASFSKGDALSSMVTDYQGGIVTGRRDLSELEDLRKRWRDAGGDQMRSEFEEQL